MNDLEREQITLEVSRKILEEIRSGDIDHGLSVADMLLSEGPQISPELLLVIVESIIELSAQAGSADARNYLKEKWPILGPSHLRRLREKLKKAS